MKKNKFSLPLLKLLYKEGLISGYSEKKEGAFVTYLVWLKYFQGNPLINKLTCISKPGKPIYKSVKDLREYKELTSEYIVSTVEGLLKPSEAIEKNLGGILLCKVNQ